MAQRISIREVGPRDGLQACKSIMPTEAKLAWIAAMVAAGVSDIEVASFVPPSVLPQMADAGMLVPEVIARHPGIYVATLAPNLRGAQAAVASGAHAVLVPVSASEAHSLSNVRRTRAEAVAEFSRVAGWMKTLDAPPKLIAGVPTAFGCSLQGEVPEAEVVAHAVALAEAGADEVCLADTLGYAHPSQVRRLLRTVIAELGADRVGNLHLHDTMGSALANAMAGLEAGVRGFDSALGGLGGCPFAPGSVGNVNTEDLVFMLESEGLHTGIDLAALIAARDVLRAGLPNEPLNGRVAAAGIPRTFRTALAA